MTNEITQSPAPVVMAFAEKMEMAAMVAKSGMFGVKSQEQAIVLMGICEATGLHPMRACQDYHIISGRPALTADAMLARFQQAGGKVNWDRYDDEGVTGTFTHPQGGSLTVDWTIQRANKAGLNSPNWKKFPRNMLRARVASEAIRALLPGIVSGTYTPEEVMDFDSPSPAQPQAKPPIPKQEPKEVVLATEAQVDGFWKEIGKNDLESFVTTEQREEIEFGLTKPRLNQIYKDIVAESKAKTVEAEPVPAEEVDSMMGERPND